MNSSMNTAVRKIHNLLHSGAVTVTGPNQPRILKQKISSNTVVSNNIQQQQVSANRCYVCDDALPMGHTQHSITEMQTSHTATKFPNKIGHLVGEAFTVIISADDVVCARCTNLINYLDRLENDVERVRSNLINLLHKKYGINDDGGGGGGGGGGGVLEVPSPKIQRLNSGATITRVSDEVTEANRTRKVVHMGTDSVMGKQTPPVSAVQQIKISTQPTQQLQPAIQTQTMSTSAGTQTIQRKTTRIYKCLTCEYKTSDMRLFNTHYETCKQQNFQCKNCKKIFPNFGTMKQHMVREHNTSMDNTCSVCHINFISEVSLRKHMELNHSTNVLVTTTVPMSSVVNEVTASSNTNTAQNVATNNAMSNAVSSSSASSSAVTTTPLYTCAQCQFKTTDKPLYDDHVRKHLTTVKPKPFKCRLCSQRFETREAATIHAKQHQPNYFKCGTCSMSFSKREQLVKHFEAHQQQTVTVASTTTTTHTQQQQHNVQQITLSPNTTKQLTSQSTSPQNLLTTQKLLQETIDEALSESVSAANTTASTETSSTAAASSAAASSASASNIRFYSCHVCSLTFLQENYYNQHMETHRRDEKKVSGSLSGANASGNSGQSNSMGGRGTSSMNSTGGGGVGVTTIKKGDNGIGIANARRSDSNSAADADIESIFEKMHSDKSDTDIPSTVSVSVSSGKSNHHSTSSSRIASNGIHAQTQQTTTTTTTTTKTTAAQDNLVITSQEGSGGITFNITIPEASAGNEDISGEPPSKKSALSIDMPTLDQPDDGMQTVKTETKDQKSENPDADHSNTTATAISKDSLATSVPVSMPSLDDDNETTEHQSAGTIKIESGTSPAGETKSHDTTKPKESVKSEMETETDTNEDVTNGSNAAATSAETTSEKTVDDSGNANANSSDVEGNEGLTAEQLAAGEHHQHVAMELDEAMQAQVESGQIKFILNENGQLLQLDNHIITDADGNQILVQDPEQIQQLLQSALLQSGDTIDSETLQMMTDNGQMVLVHGENNETQLIDASLLNADGQLVIQQGQDGELGEGTHVISDDGTRIPVSVSYTADGQPIVQVQHQVLSTTTAAEDAALEKEVAAATGESSSTGQGVTEVNDGGNDVATTQASGSSTSGGFYSLEDLMQQQQQHAAETKSAE